MLAITDEILRMAHINGLYGSQRLHRLVGDEKGVIRIQRQIEKETDEWHKLREKERRKR